MNTKGYSISSAGKLPKSSIPLPLRHHFGFGNGHIICCVEIKRVWSSYLGLDKELLKFLGFSPNVPNAFVIPESLKSHLTL